MNERLKQVRKSLNLSQSDFGKAIGLSQSAVAGIETGNREVTSRTVLSMCVVFGVNETWMRTGNGEMFIPKSTDEELAILLGKITKKGTSESKKRVMKSIIQLINEIPEELYPTIGEYVEELAKAFKEEKDGE